MTESEVIALAVAILPIVAALINFQTALRGRRKK
jgi:hypothetical protein